MLPRNTAQPDYRTMARNGQSLSQTNTFIKGRQSRHSLSITQRVSVHSVPLMQHGLSATTISTVEKWRKPKNEVRRQQLFRPRYLVGNLGLWRHISI